MEMANLIYQWFKGKKCKPLTAPFNVTLLIHGNKNVVQPDIIVICDTENIDENGRYIGIPSLVIEVLSQTTKNKYMLKKLDLYTHSGVREYWIANPFSNEIYLYYFENKTITDYKVYKGNEAVQSIYFQGLEIPLQNVFAF